MIKFPLSALRNLSSSKRGTIVVEISMDDVARVNEPETIDEIINEARLDYAAGNYTAHKTAKGLIAALDA